MFTLQHQDGDILYKFENGGFTIENSLLSFSIDAKAIEKESFPSSFAFSIDSYPIDSNCDIIGNEEDNLPNIYVYSTFHAYERKANIDIKMVDENTIEVTFKVTSEDVNYYNEYAKANDFIGTIKLTKKEKQELWIPD